MKKRKDTTRTVAGIRVGKPDVEPSASAHVRGVYEGNRPHRLQRHKGLEHEEETWATGNARRSTGIRPSDKEAIDPRMPKLSPS